MRYETFEKDKYYLISNTGSNNENIFLDEEDFARFVFLITHFQSPTPIYNSSWSTRMYLRKGKFTTTKGKLDLIMKNKSLDLMAFSIQKNGFKILVKNRQEALPSVYMHRVSTAYSKYFNSKYSKKGHVFNGPFKSELVLKPDILNTIKMIHESREKDSWSSQKDYEKENRFGELLNTEEIS